jgi:hypothetical protein
MDPDPWTSATAATLACSVVTVAFCVASAPLLMAVADSVNPVPGTLAVTTTVCPKLFAVQSVRVLILSAR